MRDGNLRQNRTPHGEFCLTLFCVEFVEVALHGGDFAGSFVDVEDMIF